LVSFVKKKRADIPLHAKAWRPLPEENDGYREGSIYYHTDVVRNAVQAILERNFLGITRF